MRAWRFSSATSGSRALEGRRQRVAGRPRTTSSMGMVDEAGCPGSRPAPRRRSRLPATSSATAWPRRSRSPAPARRRRSPPPGRVDAAGQPDDHLLEAVLAHVVARAQHQRLVDLRRRRPRLHRALGGQRRLRRGRRRAGDLDPARPACSGDAGARPCAAAGRAGARGSTASRSRSATIRSSSNCLPRASSSPSRRASGCCRRRPARPGRRPGCM